MDTTDHSSKLIDSLQEILQKNYDAEAGLKQVQEKTESASLKKWLSQKAAERNRFAAEIKTELKKLGGETDVSKSFAGSAHRLWIDVKTALTSDNDETVLEECIRGDKASLEEYKEQLAAPYMAGAVVGVLADQKAVIEQSIQTFKRLEDIVD